jgi:hypothetical protein
MNREYGSKSPSHVKKEMKNNFAKKIASFKTKDTY